MQEKKMGLLILITALRFPSDSYQIKLEMMKHSGEIYP